MNPTFEFCDARAREAAEKAQGAQLTNVRDQALRAEAAWRSMADRQRAVLAARNAKVREDASKALAFDQTDGDDEPGDAFDDE